MAEETSIAKNFLAGGFSGACAIVVGQPLDTIKVRLQTQPTPGPGQRPLYNGLWDCFLKIFRNETFFGLYKGMSAPLLSTIPLVAMGFTGFSLGKRLQQKTPDEVLTPTQLVIAGMFSGALRTFVTVPGDRIKVLLQAQATGMTQHTFDGPVDVAKALYKEGGLISFYRGFGVTLLRDIPSIGSFYASYSLIRRALSSDGDEESLDTLQIIFSGGIAGINAWLITLPFDVMKSRMQAAPDNRYPNGVRSVAIELLHTEGPSALFKGIVPVMIRAFPANAALFLGYEAAVKFMNWTMPNL